MMFHLYQAFSPEAGLAKQLWQIVSSLSFNRQYPLWDLCTINIAQKMKFYIKDIFSKCDQIRIYLRIWSHLLKKPWMEKLHYLCNVYST